MTERSSLQESTTQQANASEHCSSQSLVLGRRMRGQLRFSCELLFGMVLVYEELQYANIIEIMYICTIIRSALDL
jgi:hypothetical protein